jgi:T5SS/PEP-CTERM-associated repeat protein
MNSSQRWFTGKQFAVLLVAIAASQTCPAWATIDIGNATTETRIVDGTLSNPSIAGGPTEALRIGVNGGDGTLDVKFHGTVTTGGELRAGDGTGSVGHLFLGDSGATIGADVINVGMFGGQAFFEISRGATASSNAGFIGNYNDSQGAVTIRHPSSAWQIAGRFDVGAAPAGGANLFIDDGGSVTAGYTIVAIGGQRTIGGVSVFGPGSKLEAIGGVGIHPSENGAIKVGFTGDGGVVISDGATMNSLIGQIGVLGGSRGKVWIGDDLPPARRATWHNDLSLLVGGGDVGAGERVGGRGLLHIGATGDVFVGQRLRIFGTGEFRLDSGGTLETDTLTLESGGIIDYELGLQSAPIETSIAVLEGNLKVRLDDGFTLAPFTEYPVLNIVNQRVGQFASLAEGSLVDRFGGTELYITYSGGDGNDVALYTLVPEPFAISLTVVGGAWVCGMRHRRPAVSPVTPAHAPVSTVWDRAETTGTSVQSRSRIAGYPSNDGGGNPENPRGPRRK